MLKPEISVPAGLATGAVVYAIFQNATPSIADIRSLPEKNQDIAASEKQASWIAAGIVSGISLIARDPVIFWFGSAAVIGMAWWTRHANHVVPSVGKPMTPTEQAISGSVTTGAPMMATQPITAPGAHEFLS